MIHFYNRYRFIASSSDLYIVTLSAWVSFNFTPSNVAMNDDSAAFLSMGTPRPWLGKPEVLGSIPNWARDFLELTHRSI